MRKGKHHWNISTNAIRALNRIIQRIKYFELEWKKPIDACTCSPWCKTSVSLKNGQYKKIDNYHGSDSYPEELRKFENAIDRIIGIDKYIGMLKEKEKKFGR